MKKSFLILLVAITLLSMLCLSSCRKQTDKFFSGNVLKDCQIADLPYPVSATDLHASSKDSLYFNTTPQGFEENAEQIYNYLVGKEFEYFGYRGAELSSFFGGAPEYEFFTSAQLSDHQYLVNRHGFEYENCYVFVWSNGLSENNGLLDEGVIELIYDSSNEEYNTLLVVKYNKNVLTSYTLTEKNQEIGIIFQITEPLENAIEEQVFQSKYELLVYINNNFTECKYFYVFQDGDRSETTSNLTLDEGNSYFYYTNIEIPENCWLIAYNIYKTGENTYSIKASLPMETNRQGSLEYNFGQNWVYTITVNVATAY